MPGFATAINGLPGFRSAVSTGFRNVFRQGTKSYAAGNYIIDGTKSRDTGNTDDVDRLRPGLLMGKITSGGKYANSVLGVTGVLHDTSVVTTTMTLPAAVVTEIERRIGASGTFKITGPPTANGTVATETVTYSAIASATTITITATSADFAAGSLIQPTDGSETPITLIDDGNPIPVTDSSGTSQDQPFSQLLVGGILDASQIISYGSDTSIQAWIRARLSTVSGGKFVFDDQY